MSCDLSFVRPPPNIDFHHNYAEDDDQNGTSHQPQRHPSQGVTLGDRRARIAGRTIITPQKQSEISEVVGLATQQSVFVLRFQTFIFAFPLARRFIIEAQTDALGFGYVRRSQADYQRPIQLSN